MSEQIVTAGAFAIFRAENPLRISELSKRTDDADKAIAAAFESDKNRYLQKFRDLQASLKTEGLVITRGAA